MRGYLQSKLYYFSFFIEMFISLILSIVLLILAGRLAVDAIGMTFSAEGEDVFTYLLENAMNIAVGVELIKMLCKHSPMTVVEVLMFAIARQMIVAHASVWDTLIGVVCIAILFATRKYLFIAHDDVTRVTLRATQSVKMANALAKVHIPVSAGKTLRDVIEKHLQEEDKELAVGTCVDYDNFALCIASIHDDVITRVDILKTN
ncbi:MAG: transporter [Lachnospira sp.]|nr:transporter [Lachnospira sp.]